MKPITEILQLLASGQISVIDAQQQLSSREIAAIDGATIDVGRPSRCGFGEVIYGEGKTPELIGEIAERLLAQMPTVLVTRLTPEAMDKIALPCPAHHYSSTAQTLRIARDQALLEAVRESASETRPVAVLTAGSTDASVAAEAVETLHWMRVPVRELCDVGVAGPQRLLANLDVLEGCAAAVVVAGMEGALPSVVAGHVPYPIVAVPTSVGYGVAMGGLTALLSMLTSCAANVAVVNIDAGFKGAYLAGLVANGQTNERLPSPAP